MDRTIEFPPIHPFHTQPLDWELRDDGFITGTANCTDTPTFRDAALANNEHIRQQHLRNTPPTEPPTRRPRRLQ